MNFINEKTSKQKLLNIVLKTDGYWMATNAQKLFSRYLKDRVCNIKHYLSYTLMIINQNILAILRIFLNLQASFMKHFTV